MHFALLQRTEHAFTIISRVLWECALSKFRYLKNLWTFKQSICCDFWCHTISNMPSFNGIV